MVNFKIPAT